MRITLPFPPSVNTYWRHPTTGKLAGRHLISEKGRAYRAAVAGLLSGQTKINGRVKIDIIAHAPDNRRRDLDNLIKAIFDAITHAGLIDDDSDIYHFSVGWALEKGEKKIGGYVVLDIQSLTSM